MEKGIGPGSAGQSGDTKGLSNVAEAGSESVEELIEEGQAFEAEVISGVENAPDPDVDEVHTKQVPEDDVPVRVPGQRLGPYAGLLHFQLRISGRSSPFLSMYCLCSISLSLSCCFR